MNITNSFQHPEDEIYHVKTFINELQLVQETYFNKLAAQLNMTKKGEEFLFDYVYNECENLKDFSEYLKSFDINFDDLVDHKTEEIYGPIDFGDGSLMMHMNLHEPELDTAFPNAFDDKEQVSSDPMYSNDRIQ